MKRTMMAYLREHLRANLKLMIYLMALALVITFALASEAQIHEYANSTEYFSSIGIPVTLLVIGCYVLPVVEFSPFKKRRNLDCFYALPLSRRALALVHYLSGLIMLTATYTVSYLTNTLLLLRAPEQYTFAPLVGHFFVSLALGIAIYSFFVFVYDQANSSADGICFIILWSFILTLALPAVCDLFSLP